MQRTIRPILAVLLVLVPLSVQGGGPVFTQVINIPPDPNIGNNGSIGSNTQLNLFDGGSIGSLFNAGSPSGTQQIEVNIYGGTVANQFFAGSGSVINLRGGSPLGLFGAGADSVVNITGGGIGALSSAAGNSVVNLYSGAIGRSFEARFNSTVNVYGGTVDRQFTAALSSVANIYGGVFQNDFDAVQNSAVHLYGRRFILGGTDITSTMVPGFPRNVPERNTKLLATLADGSLFDYDLNSGINFLNQDFLDSTSTLTITLVPEPDSLALVFLAIVVGLQLPARGRSKLRSLRQFVI